MCFISTRISLINVVLSKGFTPNLHLKRKRDELMKKEKIAYLCNTLPNKQTKKVFHLKRHSLYLTQTYIHNYHTQTDKQTERQTHSVSV